MGSLVVSEVVHDARFPWSAMGRHHSNDSYTERPRTSSINNNNNNNSPTPQSHFSSRSATLTASSQSTTTASQTPQFDTASSSVRSPREVASNSASKASPAPAQGSAPSSPSLPPADASPPAQAQPQASGSNASESSSGAASPAVSSTDRSANSSASASPARIKVKNLQHIQSFINDDSTVGEPCTSPSSQGDEEMTPSHPQYEISDMPVNDVIEMVAGLLTKITSTNDQQHEHLHRQIPPAEGAAGMSQQTSSVLSFHGKNVPSITILSYLSRIQRYCPTTYEVFLSLLVYFDRMTERVNSAPLQSLRRADRSSQENISARSPVASQPRGRSGNPMPIDATPPSPAPNSTKRVPEAPPALEPPSPPLSDSDSYNLSQFFVVDSYNIHRLVIAGVTCASKFFSDVFYTNSRYAKVGGLPLVELNHLELQFLLLNDFRLSIPVEELEAYATMLVEFYAREVLAQRQSEGQEAEMEGVDTTTAA